ncbi:MAG TPA: PilZ domain-containing protein [Candidatus Eisenbacteria bacterium]|nr:PilZ domain-containing protein [Candidatus Eisenbacteria bacterium]
MERERRRTPRYMFFASAELLEEKSEVRVASRVSELSRHGCYLDMMNPFPTNTQVLVKIWKEESNVFQTRGKVIYSQPNRGAGVAFQDIEDKYVPTLEEWLAQAAKES